MTLSRLTTKPGCLVARLRHEDRAAWERLSRAYQVFDEDLATDEEIATTWARLVRPSDIRGLGAYVGDELIGIAHYHFHTHMWHGSVCYLEDLFVDEAVRGRGAGQALIEAIADEARERGCFRLYWVTKQSNTQARRLYDRIATNTGYVRYDMPLERR
jgi:GNAT superfamily N-acetyltransferase